MVFPIGLGSECALGGVLPKCLECGELARQGESLCLECRWARRQLRKDSGLPDNEPARPIEPITPTRTPSYSEKVLPDVSKTDNLIKSDPPQPPSPRFDSEALDLLEELVELQKVQNDLSKRIAGSTGGILLFIVLAAIGALLVWLILLISSDM